MSTPTPETSSTSPHLRAVVALGATQGVYLAFPAASGDTPGLGATIVFALVWLAVAAWTTKRPPQPSRWVQRRAWAGVAASLAVGLVAVRPVLDANANPTDGLGSWFLGTVGALLIAVPSFIAGYSIDRAQRA